jgi:hypothetical protein
MGQVNYLYSLYQLNPILWPIDIHDTVTCTTYMKHVNILTHEYISWPHSSNFFHVAAHVVFFSSVHSPYPIHYLFVGRVSKCCDHVRVRVVSIGTISNKFSEHCNNTFTWQCTYSFNRSIMWVIVIQHAIDDLRDILALENKSDLPSSNTRIKLLIVSSSNDVDTRTLMLCFTFYYDDDNMQWWLQSTSLVVVYALLTLAVIYCNNQVRWCYALLWRGQWWQWRTWRMVVTSIVQETQMA